MSHIMKEDMTKTIRDLEESLIKETGEDVLIRKDLGNHPSEGTKFDPLEFEKFAREVKKIFEEEQKNDLPYSNFG